MGFNFLKHSERDTVSVCKSCGCQIGRNVNECPYCGSNLKAEAEEESAGRSHNTVLNVFILAMVAIIFWFAFGGLVPTVAVAGIKLPATLSRGLKLI